MKTRLLVLGPLSAVLCIVVAACSDSRERPGAVTAPRGAIAASMSGARSMFVSYDDKLAAIAAAEPAFGGLYNDAGVLTVVVTDTTRPPEAVRSAITRVLNVPRFRSMPIRLRLGRYGFAQLYTWNKSLPGQSSIPGVISYGVDQVQNRITIGVRNDATAALMRQALAARAIPAEAVIIFTRPPIYFTSSLGDRLRDIWGGPHMDFSTSAGSWCTLGLVVKDTTGRMLAATNGHCSNSWGTGYDGTPYWQASRSSSSDSIGVEGRESIVYYNSQDSSCKYGDACKLSDISFVVLDSTAAANSEVGYLYKPTVRSRFDSSLTVGTTPLQIENKQLYPTVGDTVDKRSGPGFLNS